MKNKNGFIATSVMLSFFLIFILLSVLVLTSYTHYRILINDLNMSILTDLNENVISKKYSGLTNVILDGSMNSIRTSKQEFYKNWQTNNSFPESSVNDVYVALKKSNSNSNSSFSQSFNSKLNKGDSKKIYVVFNHQRNYGVDCVNEDFNATLKIGSTPYIFNQKNLACGRDFMNWSIYSKIFTVNVNSDEQSLEIMASNIRYHGIENIRINNVMVVDITNLYKDGTTDEDMKKYLDKYLPYFDGNYSLPKI